jgi:hypothetical protein
MRRGLETGSKDVSFLKSITPQAKQDDFKRLVKLLSQPAKAGLEVVRAGTEASKRYCQDAKSFERFVKNGGLDALGMIAPRVQEAQAAYQESRVRAYNLLERDHQSGSDDPDSGRSPSKESTMIKLARDALASLEDAACSWLARVDHVEFQDMPVTVAVAKWLGCVSRLVAFHALKTLERFVLHRRANCKALLDQGALPVLHQMLGTHRSPELVLESLSLLFRLTDPPGNKSVKHIVEEQELVTTVVQSLKSSDSDMRIQLAGLRLLSLWSQWPDAALQELLARSRACDELDRAVKDLLKTGAPHMAMWLRTVAMRSLPRGSEAPPSDASPHAAG